MAQYSGDPDVLDLSAAQHLRQRSVVMSMADSFSDRGGSGSDDGSRRAREDSGELLLSEQLHPVAVTVALVGALVLLISGAVGAIGVAVTETCSGDPTFPAQNAGSVSVVYVFLTFVSFIVVFAVERSAPSTRTRVRNFVFMLSVVLLFVSAWLKQAVDIVIRCRPGTAYAVVNVVSATLMVLWYVIVIWSPLLTR